MEERIQKAVAEALQKMGIGDVSFVVERPSNKAYGDYAVFIGMKNAEEVAKSIQEKLGNSVSEIAVAGAGFVNITLSHEAVSFAVAEADAKGEEWGKGTAESGKRVIVEYTDANPFKEMHIGHLMSNIIGESLARLIENESAEVIRANYQGDVGPHVAKALWGYSFFGKEFENLSGGSPEAKLEEKVDLLGQMYVYGNLDYAKHKEEIDEINVEIYAGKMNSLVKHVYDEGRKWSLAHFEKIYRILGTHFDYYFFESETAEPGLRIVRDGLEKGIFEESEGAVIYRGEKKGLHTLVFITSAGTPTYEAKDIGLAFLKEERVQSDRSLIVTAAEQIGHFKVMLAALGEIAPLIAKKTEHVSHGFLRLTTGKMSSREGNVITAEGFINSITKRTLVKNPDPLIAEQVALGAIKYMILRQAPGSDIIFDEEKSLSLDGDSGPYLQYALVRARKILTYAGGENGTDIPPAPYVIERLILHFPEVAARAARETAPNLLVNYLTELAGEWNSFYATEQVLGSSEEIYKQRVTRAFANTMTNGLALLGIPATEKM